MVDTHPGNGSDASVTEALRVTLTGMSDSEDAPPDGPEPNATQSSSYSSSDPDEARRLEPKNTDLLTFCQLRQAMMADESRLARCGRCFQLAWHCLTKHVPSEVLKARQDLRTLAVIAPSLCLLATIRRLWCHALCWSLRHAAARTQPKCRWQCWRKPSEIRLSLQTRPSSEVSAATLLGCTFDL